jgi:hypothetical protein
VCAFGDGEFHSLLTTVLHVSVTREFGVDKTATYSLSIIDWAWMVIGLVKASRWNGLSNTACQIVCEDWSRSPYSRCVSQES